MTRIFVAIISLFFATSLAAEDSRVGYYYPEISSEETFERVIRSSSGASKAVRLDFINRITSAQLKSPESPRFVFFGKGNAAKSLILVALDDEVFSTVYRARALLAQLTVSVRQGGFFREQDLQEVATFFDLLQLLEFDELTVSDGETWTHKVNFKR